MRMQGADVIADEQLKWTERYKHPAEIPARTCTPTFPDASGSILLVSQPAHLHLSSSLLVVFPDAGILLLQPNLLLLQPYIVLDQITPFLLELYDLLLKPSVLPLDPIPVLHGSMHLTRNITMPQATAVKFWLQKAAG